MIGVDSSVIIDVLRNKSSKNKLEMFANEDFCTSEIVVYEVLCGIYASKQMTEKQIDDFKAVLDTFLHVFPINRNASEQAAKITGRLSKAGKMIGHSDALIAGSLLVNGCRNIMTKNVSEFERIQEIKIIQY